MNIHSIASSSRGNCYLIEGAGSSLMIECGIRFPLIRRGTGFVVSSLAGCLVSHEHQDHARAVKDMIKAGVDCYMSQGTADAIGATGHRVKALRPLEQTIVGPWTVLPFPTVHDAAEPLGFLIAGAGKKLLFATDTAYIHHRFRGITHLMLEANYCSDILNRNVDSGIVSVAQKNRLIFSHFGLENVLEFLKANDFSKLEEIYLIHLSSGNSDEKVIETAVKSVTTAKVWIAKE